MCAPVVVCKTPIYHPNVDEQVCTSLVLLPVCVVTGAPIAGSRLFEHFAGGLETGGHSVICEARYVIMCDAQVLDIAACVHGLLFLFLVSGVWLSHGRILPVEQEPNPEDHLNKEMTHETNFATMTYTCNVNCRCRKESIEA